MPLRHTGEAEVQLYSDITFAPDGVTGQHHAQAALCPVEEPPSIHLIGRWAGPIIWLDVWEEGKISCLSGIKLQIGQPIV
jgi:hypothetical protein